MKAIVASQYGSPDVLELKDVENPQPETNEILVKVHAATVNAGDSRMRAFRVPWLFWLPARLTLGLFRPRQPIYGMELAGVVAAVGSKVTRFKVGDAVLASTLKANFGAHAEYKCLPEDGAVVMKPDQISFEDAATLPTGAITALYFLKKGGIQPGQKVLIYGASGSVGTFAVQLARHFGAEVTGVCSTANLELVKSLGAQQVIDYTQTDFTQNGQSYDLIFDTVGKLKRSQCQRSLTAKGRFLSTFSTETAFAEPAALDFLTGLAASGELKPVIDRRYALEQLAEAHRYVDQGHKKGNVVIAMSSALAV
ncbi:MAG: NAD(P)-dependent alcohol dehydrogenase [Candidatus Melainabacteria bacterium HGW-Melainabacteria-1]|nr:MAG: NAD(P)-dependent alcohol dehydrogenase [Candidatus Melainabacteria bacterium HGW-Melainabacteria-1]